MQKGSIFAAELLYVMDWAHASDILFKKSLIYFDLCFNRFQIY